MFWSRRTKPSNILEKGFLKQPWRRGNVALSSSRGPDEDRPSHDRPTERGIEEGRPPPTVPPPPKPPIRQGTRAAREKGRERALPLPPPAVRPRASSPLFLPPLPLACSRRKARKGSFLPSSPKGVCPPAPSPFLGCCKGWQSCNRQGEEKRS